MPDFRIRTATLEDTEMLSHIGVATFLESYTDAIEGPAMMAHCTHEHSKKAYETYLDDAATGCWLAVHAKTEAPMGYALNCTPDLPIALQDGDLELKRIYVLSKFHGSGIAAALLDASMTHARAQDAPRLLLGTYEENHRAVRFYKNNSFAVVGTRKFNVGGKIYDDIIMAKSL